MLFIAVLFCLAATVKSDELSHQIKIENLMHHLTALELIAKQNGNTRSIQSPGYNASANYVVESLLPYSDYWTVTKQMVPVNLGVAKDIKVQVDGHHFSNGLRLLAFFEQPSSSEPIHVKGGVFTAASGANPCEAASYAGVKKGDAVYMRELLGCSEPSRLLHELRLLGAVTAIARGSVDSTVLPLIRSEARRKRSRGRAAAALGPFPIFFAHGAEINNVLEKGVGELALQFLWDVSEVVTPNVIATSVGGDPQRTIISGSHLDSVPEGPGINDNGSGSAFNLEAAIQLAKNGFHLDHRLVIAWWTAEEVGLLGSTHYVDSLSPEELKRIHAVVNYDMMGSPNSFFGVYNGTESKDPVAIEIQKLYRDEFLKRGAKPINTPFDGRSDYGPFLAKGISCGGLFSGAEVLMSVEERDYQGFGNANTAYDVCYHEACDSLANINQHTYIQFAEVAAVGIQRLAQAKE